MASSSAQKVMTQPINQIFRLLQNQTRVRVWLFENKRTRMEGQVVGFDEYMNLVLEDAHEVDCKSDERTSLGRILLKGDTITLLQDADAAQ